MVLKQQEDVRVSVHVHEDGMEKEEKPQGPDGTADTKMFLLRYCFGRPPLLLTKRQTEVYCQMMAAINQAPYDVRPF